MGPHVILTLVVVLPVAWLLSEFQPHRWLRIATGLGAIAMSFGVAAVFGSFERFNSNAWYGEASWNLIGATIEEIESFVGWVWTQHSKRSPCERGCRLVSNSMPGLDPAYETQIEHCWSEHQQCHPARPAAAKRSASIRQDSKEW